jgi:ABC-type Na+ efflux pump permease subunit
MNNITKAIIAKDIKEIFSSKQIYIPMIIVPIIFTIVIPTVLIIGAKYNVNTINGMDMMVKNLSSILGNLTPSQQIIYIALNYMFPPLFLIIPLMCSSIIGASSIVGEKERKTLETILYTPIDIKDLIFSKVIAIFIPSYTITIISFILFGIVMNIGGITYFDKLIFPNLSWIILLLWICPGITFLGLLLIVITSAKASNFQEAQQMSGLIVVPIVFLVVGQASGLFLLNNLILIMAGIIVLIVDIILFDKITKSFDIEKLLN